MLKKCNEFSYAIDKVVCFDINPFTFFGLVQLSRCRFITKSHSPSQQQSHLIISSRFFKKHFSFVSKSKWEFILYLIAVFHVFYTQHFNMQYFSVAPCHQD